VATIIGFALQVLSSPAYISDADVDGLRGHGYSDEQIAEVVALVALQLMTGAFNLVAGVER
jgi:alkylhydroperoxidase family enzyme